MLRLAGQCWCGRWKKDGNCLHCQSFPSTVQQQQGDNAQDQSATEAAIPTDRCAHPGCEKPRISNFGLSPGNPDWIKRADRCGGHQQGG
jgi:hypothetical protein